MAKGRLSELAFDQLTAEQLVVYNEILASRSGSIEGPFLAWLRSPQLADRAQSLGAFCRYHTSLSRRLSELVILITARHWRANVEWQIHAPLAREEGLSNRVIDSLLAGQAPDFAHRDEQAIYDFAVALLESGRVNEQCYQSAVELLGEQGVVELTGILGYYSLVAMTLNVFEVALPEQAVCPFPEDAQ